MPDVQKHIEKYIFLYLHMTKVTYERFSNGFNLKLVGFIYGCWCKQLSKWAWCYYVPINHHRSCMTITDLWSITAHDSTDGILWNGLWTYSRWRWSCQSSQDIFIKFNTSTTSNIYIFIQHIDDYTQTRLNKSKSFCKYCSLQFSKYFMMIQSPISSANITFDWLMLSIAWIDAHQLPIPRTKRIEYEHIISSSKDYTQGRVTHILVNKNFQTGLEPGLQTVWRQAIKQTTANLLSISIYKWT